MKIDDFVEHAPIQENDVPSPGNTPGKMIDGLTIDRDFERKDSRAGDVKKKEEDRILFCKSYQCYTEQEHCWNCNRYRPVGFSKQTWNQIVKKKKER